MWINVTGLIARYSAEEIAQCADRGVPRLVSAELLKMAADGGDLSSYTEEEQAAAQASIEVIEGVVADANSTVNGYLSGRYKLPIEPAPLSVQRIAGDIARYFLYDDQATETIEKRYNASLTVLRDISTGKLSLGGQEETTAAPSSNAVRMQSAGSVWSRDKRF